jgi:hypothetical protein
MERRRGKREERVVVGVRVGIVRQAGRIGRYEQRTRQETRQCKARTRTALYVDWSTRALEQWMVSGR